MASVNEYFCNRFGLRYITPKDMRLLRQKVSRHDWSVTTPPSKPTWISRFAAHLGRMIAREQTLSAKTIQRS